MKAVNSRGNKAVFVYFDGKTLAQFQNQIKSVKRRLSVIAMSHDLPSERVVGVPIPPDNSRKNQNNVAEGAEGVGIHALCVRAGF